MRVCISGSLRFCLVIRWRKFKWCIWVLKLKRFSIPHYLNVTNYLCNFYLIFSNLSLRNGKSNANFLPCRVKKRMKEDQQQVTTNGWNYRCRKVKYSSSNWFGVYSVKIPDYSSCFLMLIAWHARAGRWAKNIIFFRQVHLLVFEKVACLKRWLFWKPGRYVTTKPCMSIL